MEHILSEEKLIEYAKKYLKTKGFKKKNKRWTKDIGEFTLSFCIQGSTYDKEDYYIRPGVFINAIPSAAWMYGHFMTQIEPTTPEEIMQKFEQWCEEWTDKVLIKERLLAFMDWENRRANSVDYTAGPVPAEEFLAVDVPPTVPSTKQYILNNF